MKFDRRDFLAATGATALLPDWASAASPVLRPEHFGARGDGATNDTAAFARLGDEVNRRGGGTIALTAGKTYVVGSQSRGPQGQWIGDPILELHHLSAPLVIMGNGARLRAAGGLRFGTFDPQTGDPVQHPMPYTKAADLSLPYRGMIWIHHCRAPVALQHVELDGNAAQLRIGGKFGDKGWQVPATGLFLAMNAAPERIDNLYTHHHGLDGAMFNPDPARSGRTAVTRMISRHNGRQGLSIIGGHGYDFADCEFSHTGRGTIKSPPAAGVDIEAEHPPIRDLTFIRCSFVDNAGCGLLADSGNTAGARFTDCRFIGTTSWSAWPRKPQFSFEGCTFVGSVVHPFPSDDPNGAARFTRCTFTDDPRASPTGEVFVGGGPIVNMGQSKNVLFDSCTFNLVANGVLPWGWNAIYRDCTMRQRSPKTANTKGTYLGSTTISGPVDLYGSDIEGTVIVNGRPLPRGHIG
jgi:hypothetical protein